MSSSPASPVAAADSLAEAPRTSALPSGLLKSVPEDFRVEEIPLYLAEGVGDHLYVTFEKRDLTTPQAVKRIADVLQIPPRDIGIAGMKDKIAVTTQTISLPASGKFASIDDAVARLDIPGVKIQEAKRHRNKLKTGHLLGNRFSVRVRGIDRAALPALEAAFLATETQGVPNYYGEQRFGRDGDNAMRAISTLREGRGGPRDPKQRRFLFSAAQSEAFNRVLAARVADGTWNRPQLGELLEKTGTHAVFLCTDAAGDHERCARFEVCPTGPMPGVTMKRPEGAIGALEERIVTELFGEDFPWDRTKALGEGTRRALQLQVQAPCIRVEESLTDPATADVLFDFVLARGSYATTVLGALLQLREPSRGHAAPATPDGTEAGLSESDGDDGSATASS